VEEETARDCLISCPSGGLVFASLSGFASLVTRGSVAKTPYFLETISCLAPIPGESSGSGRGLGLDARAILAVLSLCQGGSLGPYWDGAPDSSSGLIIGDFTSGQISGHEGRGAGKTDPPGGHIKVNRKKIVRETHPH
jgi:hypothetical protein